MERFRVKVAGNSPALHAIELAEREAMAGPTIEEHLNLSARVVTLEKEMTQVINLLTIGVMVGAYFLYQWYVQKIGSIPGVDHT